MRNVSCLGFSAFLVVGVVTAKAQSKSAEAARGCATTLQWPM